MNITKTIAYGLSDSYSKENILDYLMIGQSLGKFLHTGSRSFVNNDMMLAKNDSDYDFISCRDMFKERIFVRRFNFKSIDLSETVYFCDIPGRLFQNDDFNIQILVFDNEIDFLQQYRNNYLVREYLSKIPHDIFLEIKNIKNYCKGSSTNNDIIIHTGTEFFKLILGFIYQPHKVVNKIIQFEEFYPMGVEYKQQLQKLLELNIYYQYQ